MRKVGYYSYYNTILQEPVTMTGTLCVQYVVQYS